MESTICMNERCGKTTSLDWKRGWGLKSGGFALLCCSCGLAYENSTYCLKFHLGESGWRDCKYCRKPIHCGCIASKYVHEYLDFGGVGCTRCIRDLEMQLIRPIQNPSIGISNRLNALLSNTRPQSSVLENRVNSDILDRTEFKELLNLGKTIEQKEPINFLQRHNAGPSSSNLQINRDENLLTTGEPIHFLQPHNAGPSSSNLYARPSSTNLQINQEENLLTTREPINFLQPHNTGPSLSNLQINPDENLLTATGQVSRDFFTLAPQSFRPSILSRPESSRRPTRGLKDMLESLTQQSLSFSLGSPLSTPNTALPFTDGADTSNTALPFTDGAGTSNTALPFIHWAGTSNTTLPLTDGAGTPNTALPFTDGAVEGTEKNKVPQFEESHKGRLNLQKPPKAGVSIRSGANKGTDSLTQVPRPPGEGRGRNQLLPRYWPRITDQELQQISGDLNSTIVPLFEKVLSASDAGRIGRLVLPKACAEAYFPAIDQSEGVPVRVQDIKGKEWTFQFRFWPNNNSRMYVLEGVTPCIQNMQLQAGDTVTFSKIEPSGKLVMGYRKAPINGDLQDPEDLSGETSFSYLNKNLPADSLSLPKNEENEGTRNEESLERPMLIPEKKRARNIGSKSKRLLINSDDAMKLTLSWEEAQQLLRPPLRRKPTIVMVDNHEVEEYDAPPVLGKKTMFTARESGEEDQWVQCDNCGKWRRLPVDVFLPPKWTCSDNIWDKKRSSCFAAYEIDPLKLESCLESTKEFKRRKITDPKAAKGKEQSRLGPLLRAAALNTKPGGSGAKPSGSGAKPRGSGGSPGGSRARSSSSGAKPSGSGPKPGDSGAKPSGSGAKSGDSGEPPSVPTPATTRHPRHRPGCSCIVCIQPPSGKGNHDRTCTCKVCSTVNRRFNTMMSRKKKRKSEQEAQITSKRARGAAPPIDVKIEMGDTLGPAQQPPSESEARVEASEPSRGHLDLDLNLNCQPNGEDDLMLSDSEGILPFGIHLRPSEPSTEPCLLSKAVTEIEGSSPIDRPGRGNVGDDR